MTLVTLAPTYTYAVPRPLTDAERAEARRRLLAAAKTERDAVVLAYLKEVCCERS